MKTAISALLLLFASVQFSAAQNEDFISPPGTVSGKLYSNFNYGLHERQTAFEVSRAYFGYDKQISKYFYANVKLDIGSPDDLSEYSKLRRYAYFKNAGLTFKKDKITAWFGLFDMLQFKVQEKFFGYRYLYKSYMDEYKFGPSADLGAGIQYEFNDNFSADLIISNGEGYSSPQKDDSYKTGLGLLYKPDKKITLRTYYSIFSTSNPQMTFSGFAGYDTDNFRAGAEYNYQKNYKSFPGHDRFGYSAYGTYIINDSWELFLRYDQVHSNITDDATIPWNLPNDGSAVIGGIQFSPVKGINLALDYQDWFDYAGNGGKEQILYLHVEAKF